ncbi:MAG: phosphodiester glycosidase family protein [Pedosphaera sp.]|nr:phosphodiester glycosidase family protein [Pedosphaera sp.]
MDSIRMVRVVVTALLSLLAAGNSLRGEQSAPAGATYTNHHVITVPWSIHMVSWERRRAEFMLHSIHAGGAAVGLDRLSRQISRLNSQWGLVVAGINGDFYQREDTFAGDPRGCQIVEGELISAPNGDACFWVDALGEPHAGEVSSQLQVIWENGSSLPVGMNEDRKKMGVVLYTAAMGASTPSIAGQDLVLERAGNGPWLPLRIGKTYTAKVREVRGGGGSALSPGTLVLSIKPSLVPKIPPVKVGTELTLSLASLPALQGVRTAIGGGPVLVRGGKRQKIAGSSFGDYRYSTMMERHPRSAIGWNATHFFLMEVDGRQDELSVGMTLSELSEYLFKLGCTDAMNLDGGGSATLWFNGKVRNSPCDQREREIANALVVTRKEISLPK